MKDISVILTVYNQSFPDIAFSLRSLIDQEDADFEIVIADDGSKVDRSPEIRNFLESHDFHDFKISRSEQNVKTVANAMRACSSAEGKYVKILGAGDCLFDSKVLKDVVEICDNGDFDIGFGKLSRFCTEDGEIKLMGFNAPRNRQDYESGSKGRCEKLLEHMLLEADWIPGGLQFGRRDVMQDLWTKLHDDYGIFYCEDFAATCALAKSMNVAAFDRQVMWYDFGGGGISTSGSKGVVKRMYDDNKNLYDHIARDNDFKDSFLVPRALFQLRRFIALDTPFYAFFQSKLSDIYDKADCSLEPNDMLLNCLEAKLDVLN